MRECGRQCRRQLRQLRQRCRDVLESPCNRKVAPFGDHSRPFEASLDNQHASVIAQTDFRRAKFFEISKIYTGNSNHSWLLIADDIVDTGKSFLG